MKLLLLLAALSSLAYCELINTVEYFCQVLYHCPQGTSSTKSCQEWVKLIGEATCSEPHTAFIAYTPKWKDFVWPNTRLGQPFMLQVCANYTCGLGEDGEVDPGNLEFITDPLVNF